MTGKKFKEISPEVIFLVCVLFVFFFFYRLHSLFLFYLQYFVRKVKTKKLNLINNITFSWNKPHTLLRLLTIRLR